MTAKHAPPCPAAAFEQTIRRLSQRRRKWEVFSDFCEAAAVTLANKASFDAGREARYLQVVSRYEREELQAFGELLAHVGMALWSKPCDFLGDQFMRLGLGNHWHGQFFTPWEVASLSARMVFDRESAIRAIEAKGFLTVLEPAVGAGTMVIAFADAMAAGGFDPRRHLHVTAVDIDPTAARMCFIQLALLDIPAIVYVGDTLGMQVREVYLTPAHVVGGWTVRLRMHEGGGASPSPDSASSPANALLLPPAAAAPGDADGAREIPAQTPEPTRPATQTDLFAD